MWRRDVTFFLVACPMDAFVRKMFTLDSKRFIADSEIANSLHESISVFF